MYKYIYQTSFQHLCSKSLVWNFLVVQTLNTNVEIDLCTVGETQSTALL